VTSSRRASGRTTKVERQHVVAQLLARHTITSQAQLVDLLAAKGVDATQATVSRDLEDLGAVKVRVPAGDSVYAIPEYEPDRIAPEEQLRRVMGEWVAEVGHSGPLVVLRTPPGCAHVVASALDRSGLAGLLGTVAGDDTMICVAEEELGGARLAARLRELAGLRGERNASLRGERTASLRGERTASLRGERTAGLRGERIAGLGRAGRNRQ
jgi:transcriptional regulator of arginine metabolism